MIDRYTRPAMAELWSDRRRFERYLEVELAASAAMEEAGIVPAGVTAALRQRARVDVARIQAIEAEVHHDVIAFTTAVAETVGPEGRYLHYGLTSSDVVDTALSLTLVEATSAVIRGMDRLRRTLARRARQESHTPMAGRTHGIHAEPISFGLKLARWWDALGRDRQRLVRARDGMRVGKLSGAVGTYAHLPPHVERDAMARLGLKAAPISSQILDRDRHAELVCALAILGSTLDGIALEIRGLQRTEVGEVLEPFAAGQKGSSAMPHKRNPVRAERVCGLARVLRGHAVTALENLPLWGERDISHSSAERVILADATTLADYLLAETAAIVDGMEVRRDRMRANLALTEGRVHSGSVLLALVDAGLSREEAYRIVQAAAMTPGDFAAHLRQSPEVARALGENGLSRAMDPESALRHTDEILDRLGI
jgi:adenylosuccinate lyase